MKLFRDWSKLVAGLMTASIAALLPAGAQAEDWNAVVEKAKSEGRVNFYTVAPPDVATRVVAAFNAKYPDIQVAITRGVSELPPRIAAERQAGADGGDVYIFSDPLWFSQQKDWLLDLDTPAAANFPHDNWQVPGKAPLVSYPPFGMLLWNTQQVPGGLKTWDDLLKPEFKGRVGTREEVTLVVAGYLDFLTTELGADYLTKLAAQKPNFYASVVPMIQAVASGEISVANVGNTGAVRELVKQGAPIAYAYPEPSFAISWAGAVLNSSKRPNAARVFLDFVLTPDGQKALNGDGDGASALPNIEGTLDISGFRVLQPQKFPKDVRDKWRDEFERIFR
jgi:iron(III) transport system substrate-binding protein